MKKMKRQVERVLVFVLCCLFFTAFTAVAVEKSPAAKGVPKKAAVAKSAKKRAPNKDVLQIQEALNKEGFKLKVDGLMGPKTKGSLKKYQKKNGLKVTGKANKATLDKLLKKRNG